MEKDSISGKRYFLTFIDDKTRKIFIYFLKTKSEWEVTKMFNEFKALVENQTGKQIKVLRTDNDLEYTNKGFRALLQQHGIKQQMFTVHSKMGLPNVVTGQ